MLWGFGSRSWLEQWSGVMLVLQCEAVVVLDEVQQKRKIDVDEDSDIVPAGSEVGPRGVACAFAKDTMGLNVTNCAGCSDAGGNVVDAVVDETLREALIKAEKVGVGSCGDLVRMQAGRNVRKCVAEGMGKVVAECGQGWGLCVRMLVGGVAHFVGREALGSRCRKRAVDESEMLVKKGGRVT